MADAFEQKSADEITLLLMRSQSGEDEAFSQVVTKLYPELKRLAGYHLKPSGPITMAPTEILHEAFLKLSNHQGAFNNRAHFMAVASRAMRQIIIDYARRKATVKRGGDLKRVDFDEARISVLDQASDLLMLDQILDRLTEENPRVAKVFEYRFFGGMNDTETSEALGVPLRTIQRDWMKAKAFVALILEDAQDPK
ncbi:MAG: ECF-type sigma factor [Hyphomonadaceae bacterium]